MNLAQLTAVNLDRIFQLAAELVQPFVFCNLNTPFTGLTPPPPESILITLLITNYKTGDIPGARASVGDQRAVGRWSDFTNAGLPLPRPGDYLLTADGSIHEVIASSLDPTGKVLTMQ